MKNDLVTRNHSDNSMILADNVEDCRLICPDCNVDIDDEGCCDCPDFELPSPELAELYGIEYDDEFGNDPEMAESYRNGELDELSDYIHGSYGMTLGGFDMD